MKNHCSEDHFRTPDRSRTHELKKTKIVNPRKGGGNGFRKRPEGWQGTRQCENTSAACLGPRTGHKRDPGPFNRERLESI